MNERPPTGRFRDLGWDGQFTFALSNLTLVVTAGLSGIASFTRVWRVAWRTPATATGMDAILVPGLRITSRELPGDFVLRLERAERLLRASAAAPIVLLGGKTSNKAPSESRAAKAFLTRRGVSEERLVLEETSRNTLANLRAARDLARQNGWGVVAIVSNRYHLARLDLLAKGLGLDHHLCAAEDRPVTLAARLPRLIAEAYFVHWYVVGRLWATLTRNRKSLERIS
jgi:uncharacterized SAM-binding protein YcdF (DUF218 family)